MKNVAKGELRSVFDFKPEQTGTHRVTMLSTGVMGSYKDAKGQPCACAVRWKRCSSRSADAKEVHVIESLRRMETFVSLGKPSALGVSGKGLSSSP